MLDIHLHSIQFTSNRKKIVWQQLPNLFIYQAYDVDGGVEICQKIDVHLPHIGSEDDTLPCFFCFIVPTVDH